MKKITIAIDGYSSTGKSTVAKQLAKELKYVYVDTGAMYRAVTLYAMEKGFISENHFDKEKLIKELSKVMIDFKIDKASGHIAVFLNHKNVEKEIRSLQVSNFVSPIATLSEVRKKLVKLQQELGKQKAVVMDGRDIGTVVFPDAELKIFMTASANTRAERRYQELLKRGDKVTFEEILHNVETRDYIDTTRKDSPLIKAIDAIEIDNTEMNLEDQFHTILQLAQDRIVGRV